MRKMWLCERCFQKIGASLDVIGITEWVEGDCDLCNEKGEGIAYVVLKKD